MISNAFSKLKDSSVICIAGHRSPDADSIGSQLALYRYLTDKGHKVSLFCADPIPKKFSFLNDVEQFQSHPPTEQLDAVVIVDSSNESRVNWDGILEAAPLVINIDHHRDNSSFGTYNHVDPTAAAASHIVTEFLLEENANISPETAQALYTGIVGDTGGFQFSNTSSRLMRIAAELIDRGAEPEVVHKKLFSSYSVQGLKLRATIWSSLQFFSDNRISVLSYDEALLKDLNADRGDTEGLADAASSVEGVYAGVLVKKSSSGIHFSMRSSGLVDVGLIAQLFPGGGGHACAAGCTVENMDLQDAPAFIASVIEKHL